MWEFYTEPEFQEKLDWTAAFVRDECEPLDLLFPRPGDPYDVHSKASRAILAPLREKVKEQGLRTWRNAAGRAGEPGEVVTTALYLASAASSDTTGSLIRVDGGLY